MTNSFDNLDTNLNLIKVNYKSFNTLQSTTRKEKYTVFTKIYLWWQVARNDESYLDDLYVANNIKSYKKGEVNFRPLLRLVTNDQMLENDIDVWSKAMKKLNIEIQKHQDDFSTDSINKIVHFITLNNGLTGLSGYQKNKNPQDDDIELSIDDDMLFTLNDNEFIPTFAEEAKNFYDTNTQQQVINLPALHTTADDYSVVVIKKTANGCVLVGTTNDSDTVNTTLVGTYRNDFEALPITMRCVLETLHILNIPKVLATSWEKFVENSLITDKYSANKKKELAHKRLLYQPSTKSFILSNTLVDASVVVYAIPKNCVIGGIDADIFLPTSNRQSIETKLLHQSMFNMFTPSNTNHFTKCSPGAFASHYVSLDAKIKIEDKDGISSNQVKRQTSNLNHPPIHFLPFYGPPRWQVRAQSERFLHAWECDVDLSWLRAATTSFFDKWIAAYGKKANRPVNKILKLRLSKANITIGYEFDAKSGFDNEKAIELSPHSAHGDVSLIVRSADFGFVLRQIADLNVQGLINIFADNNAIKLVFSTTANDYICWIPSCGNNGKRNSKHFSSYHPTQTEFVKTEVDPDDEMDVEDSPAERIALKEAIIRRRNHAKA